MDSISEALVVVAAPHLVSLVSDAVVGCIILKNGWIALLKIPTQRHNNTAYEIGLKALGCRHISEDTFTQEHDLIKVMRTATKKQERVENNE